MRLFSLTLCFALAVSAQNTAPPAGRSGRGGNANQDPINERTFAALRARQIGPAMISGRILQIAVFPDSPSHYMIALAAGNIFMTENNGTTWTPVFENYGSYSIGWITIDPKNPSIVWVGTGENNSQRAAAYGDGVYKSEDGGRTFHNAGLKTSEHIGRILVDPRDSNVVYVASQGPLWKGGGERGLFKTTDGGKTWSQSLIKVDDYTGCTDVIMDPANPDVLLAATHQRQRSYFGIIHGGPGSALWRTHRRRQDLDQSARRISAGTGRDRPRPHRPELRALQSQNYLRRSGRQWQRRPLPLHRQRHHLGAP